MKKSENESQQARINASKKSKGLMKSPWAPRVKDKVIQPGKPKRVSKNPWEHKTRKRVKDA